MRGDSHSILSRLTIRIVSFKLLASLWIIWRRRSIHSHFRNPPRLHTPYWSKINVQRKNSNQNNETRVYQKSKFTACFNHVIRTRWSRYCTQEWIFWFLVMGFIIKATNSQLDVQPESVFSESLEQKRSGLINSNNSNTKSCESRVRSLV